jgi:cytochrome c
MRIQTLSLTSTLIALPAALFALFVTPGQTNHAPTVKIESPANNATLALNTPITYQIQVTDPEDGDSRYDEINTKEVILELAYPAAKSANAPQPARPTNPARPPALDIMATNNCFNCHQFNAQSLGPSFFEIAKRYPATAANTDTLISRIRNGSSGIWGRIEKMPSHPELSPAAIRSAVRWIFQNAVRPDRAWYVGTTGLLHFTRPGTYTLTATYTDHGTKDQPAQHLTGSDRITLTVK